MTTPFPRDKLTVSLHHNKHAGQARKIYRYTANPAIVNTDANSHNFNPYISL
jgi:hypothetical protein